MNDIQNTSSDSKQPVLNILMKAAYYVFIFPYFVLPYKIFMHLKSNSGENKTLKILTSLDSKFVISKAYKLQGIYVDDVNKKWAYIKDKYAKIYNYSDLYEFEVFQDGESMMRGRMGQAVVGTLVLGIVGTVIGAAGRRKQDNFCNTLQVRIKINDLQNPEIVLPFISKRTKKSSFIYRTSFETAKELAATLTYIQKNA